MFSAHAAPPSQVARWTSTRPSMHTAMRGRCVNRLKQWRGLAPVDPSGGGGAGGGQALSTTAINTYYSMIRHSSP